MKAGLRLILALILLGIVGLSVQAQTPVPPAPTPRPITWGGLYVGFQRVASLRRPVGPFARNDFAATSMVIFNLPCRMSSELQIIVPLGGGMPLYRFGVTRRLF